MNIFGKQHKDNFTDMHILLKSDHLSKNILRQIQKKMPLQRLPRIYRGFDKLFIIQSVALWKTTLYATVFVLRRCPLYLTLIDKYFYLSTFTFLSKQSGLLSSFAIFSIVWHLQYQYESITPSVIDQFNQFKFPRDDDKVMKLLLK